MGDIQARKPLQKAGEPMVAEPAEHLDFAFEGQVPVKTLVGPLARLLLELDQELSREEAASTEVTADRVASGRTLTPAQRVGFVILVALLLYLAQHKPDLHRE